MANIQLVTPNLRASDGAGWCLRFTQRVYQNLNPYYYNSAWDAWLNAAHKGVGNLPTDVSVPVYFSHWGTYGGKYANWGHIVAWVPGKGYLSSPTHGEGGQWFPNIGAVERAFNAKYVGWAYDVGGLMVAKIATTKPTPPTKPKDEDPMPLSKSFPQYNPNRVCKPGEWTRLPLNKKNDVTILFGGTKRRSGTANVAITTKENAEFDVRFTYESVNSDATKITKVESSVWGRYKQRAVHSWPVGLAAGDKRRIRVQVRPVGDKPITVIGVRPIVEYWEK